MKLPTIPGGTAACLVAFLLTLGSLVAYLISRGNVRVEEAAGFALVGLLGAVGHLLDGAKAPEPDAPKLPPA